MLPVMLQLQCQLQYVMSVRGHQPLACRATVGWRVGIELNPAATDAVAAVDVY